MKTENEIDEVVRCLFEALDLVRKNSTRCDWPKDINDAMDRALAKGRKAMNSKALGKS